MTDEPIKTLASRILSGGIATEDEQNRLAAYVLGDADPRRASQPDTDEPIKIPGN